MTDKINYGPRNFINAYRYKNYVYLRNLKCASGFFVANFKKFGWTQILFQDIDWETDVVFSHILNPIERRHKSIREVLVNYGLVNDYISNFRLQKLLRWVSNIEFYGYSYYDTFGEYCDLIKWIPLNDTHAKNLIKTQDFLRANGYETSNFLWDLSKENRADAEAKAAEKIIKKYWDNTVSFDLKEFNSNTVSNFVREYLDNSIWEYFYEDIAGASWPKCPNIQQYQTLPIEIRTEIITDHYSSHLNITLDTIEVKRTLYQINTVDDINNDFFHGYARVCLSHLEDDIELYCRVINE